MKLDKLVEGFPKQGIHVYKVHNQWAKTVFKVVFTVAYDYNVVVSTCI